MLRPRRSVVLEPFSLADVFGWNLVIAVVVGVPVARLTMIPFDRRRRWRAGKALSPPWTGQNARWRVVDLDVPHERIDTVVVDALHRCGATPEVRSAAAGWQLGYTGWNWKWGTAGTEFAIGASQSAPGRVRFWCCARPRFAIGLIDFGVNFRAARRLERALSDAAMPS